MRELSRDQCLTLLAGAIVGRLAYCTADGPQIYPVNYVLDQESVVFRTAVYTALGSEIDGQRAALEVDRLGGPEGFEWSVVLAGPAEVISDPDEVARLRHTSDPTPLAPGARPLYVRISAQRLTGRAIGRPEM
ncbi:MAG TPA: pyridoxamine 5'-phosphate oxidase family protein [Nocardioidaceae bacterium]|nr:pyridoxamine 5'-phosphate oxidase family protein [Nocardioidaceae bacterium]